MWVKDEGTVIFEIHGFAEATYVGTIKINAFLLEKVLWICA